MEWLIKGGPVPSILDDLCLGNVISKYFSKLRVGTSKIQPELKCLENILLSFYESLSSLRARLWEHELFSVRSIAFISTLVKSPDEAFIKYKAFYTRYSRECHISGVVSTSLSLAHNSLVSEPYRGTGKWWEEHYMHNVYFCTMIARFESWVNFQNASLLIFSIYAKKIMSTTRFEPGTSRFLKKMSVTCTIDLEY